MDDLDLKHAVNRLDRFIENCQQPNDNENKALLFLIANIDKIKFLAASHTPNKRQDVIYNFIRKSFSLSRDELNKADVIRILNRNKVYSYNRYMNYNGAITIFILILVKFLVFPNLGLFGIVCYIIASLVLFGISMCIAETVLQNYRVPLYRIAREYRGKFVKLNALDDARF